MNMPEFFQKFTIEPKAGFIYPPQGKHSATERRHNIHYRQTA
jgi:hypothetical protein